jgi:hypothetical protein
MMLNLLKRLYCRVWRSLGGKHSWTRAKQPRGTKVCRYCGHVHVSKRRKLIGQE